MNPITDFYGQPLKVGDRIAYPVGTGSSGVTLSESIIDLIEELVPHDPSDPTCQKGYKYSERHKPLPSRVSLELPLRWVHHPEGITVTGWRGQTNVVEWRWEYDPTKLFKLKVKNLDRDGKPSNRTSWIKNVDRVIRAPESVQS